MYVLFFLVCYLGLLPAVGIPMEPAALIALSRLPAQQLRGSRMTARLRGETSGEVG